MSNAHVHVGTVWPHAGNVMMKTTGKIKNWLIACTVLSSQAVAGASPLEALDPRFGDQGHGRQTVGFPNGYASASAVAIDPGGRIILAGNAVDENQMQNGAVIRLNFDGTIDPTFAYELTPLPLGATNSEWYAVISTANGGAIAGGSVQLPYRIGAYVCRLDSGGKFAQDFGTTETPGCSTLEEMDAGLIVLAISEQSDGSTVLAGTAYKQDVKEARVWRLTATGQLDTTFGNKGTARLPEDYYLDSEFVALDIADDDSIAVAGRYGTDYDKSQMLVARLTKEGRPMTEFAGGDRVIPFTHLPYDQRMSLATSVHVAGDGSVVVGGVTRTEDINGANIWPAIVKLSAQGQGVESFGIPGLPSGQRIIDPYNAPNCYFSPKMVVAPNGKIFIAGSIDCSQFVPRKAFAMALTSTGEIDPSFADSDGTFKAGIATAWWPEASSFGAVALQGKKIVLAGTVVSDDKVKMAAIRFRGGILFSDGFGDD